MSDNERIKLFLNNIGTTPTLWAKMQNLSVSSVRNTFSGIKPIKKVVFRIYEINKPLFEILPASAKELIA